MHILKRAKEFRATDLLQALQAGSYPWLGDALLLLDADTTMDLDTMVGLMLAMTAQGGVVAEHLGEFVQDLSVSLIGQCCTVPINLNLVLTDVTLKVIQISVYT